MSQNKQITEDYELQEWLEALDNVINESGSDRASEILSELASKLTASGTIPTFNLTTPFRNTISITDEARMPGDLFLERKIRSYIRWNALAMVLKANKSEGDLGGPRFLLCWCAAQKIHSQRYGTRSQTAIVACLWCGVARGNCRTLGLLLN